MKAFLRRIFKKEYKEGGYVPWGICRIKRQRIINSNLTLNQLLLELGAPMVGTITPERSDKYEWEISYDNTIDGVMVVKWRLK